MDDFDDEAGAQPGGPKPYIDRQEQPTRTERPAREEQPKSRTIGRISLRIWSRVTV